MKSSLAIDYVIFFRAGREGEAMGDGGGPAWQEEFWRHLEIALHSTNQASRTTRTRTRTWSIKPSPHSPPPQPSSTCVCTPAKARQTRMSNDALPSCLPNTCDRRSNTQSTTLPRPMSDAVSADGSPMPTAQSPLSLLTLHHSHNHHHADRRGAARRTSASHCLAEG